MFAAYCAGIARERSAVHHPAMRHYGIVTTAALAVLLSTSACSTNATTPEDAGVSDAAADHVCTPLPTVDVYQCDAIEAGAPTDGGFCGSLDDASAIYPVGCGALRAGAVVPATDPYGCSYPLACTCASGAAQCTDGGTCWSCPD